MKTIYAKEYGILPGRDIAAQVNALLNKLSEDDDEKILVFEKGEYYLDRENLPEPVLYITNTIGDNEWKEGEIAHKNAVGLFFNGIKNLIVEGNSSVFTLKGQATNAAFIDCARVSLKNVEFRAENPDMHALKVVKKGLGFVDFELDRESDYIVEKGRYYFVGKGYRTAFIDKRFTAHWIGLVHAENSGIIERTSHPFFGAYSLSETSNRRFRARYVISPSCKEGDEFYLFDVRRKYQGIFASGCRDLTLDGIKQRFNYGLANVYQDCENVTLKNSVFAPSDRDLKKMASVADFIQVCSCRGKIEIIGNRFCGAGDDCLNVHGVHFKIKESRGKNVRMTFMHPQTHGFCPFRKGDIVRFINTRTLLAESENEIVDAYLQDEYNIVLTLKNDVNSDIIGYAAENASACPDVVFSDNSLDRIITRGLLLTTSGRVYVENNDFHNTSMNAILVSDDAKSWYESGLVTDIGIINNRFYGTNGYYVCVKPENSQHSGYVHRGIKVFNNYFASEKSKGLYFKSTTQSEVKGNTFVYGKKIKLLKSEVFADFIEEEK